MRFAGLKVGQLAEQTGLSVRTLHYYDEIGLLTPSGRTESGHRLYSAADIVRLQQIRSLRYLGFALEDLRDLLDRPDCSPLGVVEQHLSRLREQLTLQRRLCERLEALAAQLRTAEEVSVTEILETIEVLTMFEKYYTPEQLAALEQRRAAVGDERIKQVEAAWPQLIAQVRAALDEGCDPASPRAQELAQRWTGLVREFTGGDPGIERSLATMYRQEPGLCDRSGLDPELFAFIAKAAAAGRAGA